MLIQITERLADTAWFRYQTSHNFCIKQIFVYNTVFCHETILICIIHHFCKDSLKFSFCLFLCPCRKIFHLFKYRILDFVYLKKLQQAVNGIYFVLRIYQSGAQTIFY